MQTYQEHQRVRGISYILNVNEFLFDSLQEDDDALYEYAILQTEWFAKNFITVIPAKAGIHTTPS